MAIKIIRASWRSVAQLHENKSLIAWLRAHPALAWLTPVKRRILLTIGGIGTAVAGVFRTGAGRSHDLAYPVPVLTLAILFSVLYLSYLAAAHFSSLPEAIRRRPQLSLHAPLWALFALVWFTSGAQVWRTVLFLCLTVLPFLIWRCGYVLLSGQRGKAKDSGFFEHLFYLWPAWGATPVPIGKGRDYLSQCEAKTSDAYARSLLAGIKLMVLAQLLRLCLSFLDAYVYGDGVNFMTGLLGSHKLGIPRFRTILNGAANVSLPTTWTSLYLELVRETIQLAVKGHVWVGVLRLFGFNVFRNTYKPLLAETIMDFWNRYYYYFKELLAEFFFYPIYLRHFKNRPKLRILTAVFAAAFVGNMYYHVLKSDDLLAANFAELWRHMSSRLLYCFFLATGIFLSMLRQQQRQGGVEPAAAGIPRRGIKIAGVWTFFALINFWDIKSHLTLPERAAFFVSLFGL